MSVSLDRYISVLLLSLRARLTIFGEATDSATIFVEVRRGHRPYAHHVRAGHHCLRRAWLTPRVKGPSALNAWACARIDREINTSFADAIATWNKNCWKRKILALTWKIMGCGSNNRVSTKCIGFCAGFMFPTDIKCVFIATVCI